MDLNYNDNKDNNNKIYGIIEFPSAFYVSEDVLSKKFQISIGNIILYYIFQSYLYIRKIKMI